MSAPRTAADRFIDRASGAGLLALFGIAGAASFSHIHNLAVAHGESGWRAWALPVCIDVLAVMAGFEVLRDSRAGRFGRAAFLPWLLLVAGVIASVAANVAQAEPTLTGRLIAAAPALAFIAGSKLVVRRLAHAAEAADRAAETAAAEEAPATATAPVATAAPAHCERPAPSPTQARVPAIGPTPVPVSGSEPPSSLPTPSSQLVAFARRLDDEHQSTHGRPITREALRARLRVSNEVATSLLQHLRTAPEPTA